MEETIVGFDIAKLAKEKGFPQVGNYLRKSYYNHEGKLNGDVSKKLIDMHKAKKEGRSPSQEFETIEAPTQTLLQKWLRKEYNIHVEVQLIDTLSIVYVYNILTTGNGIRPQSVFYYDYEVALEDGLKEALNLIK